MTSNQTSLLFTTYEILLRNLTSMPTPESATSSSSSSTHTLEHVTHIVLDELQLRDQRSDFVLVLVKELLARHKHIKLILVGSQRTLDFLQRHFANFPIIRSACSL